VRERVLERDLKGGIVRRVALYEACQQFEQSGS